MPRKIKQKQKQKQTQNVIVNIHEKKVKKRRIHRKKEQLPLPPSVVLGLPKVPPIVVQYTEPASLSSAPAPTAPVPVPPAPARATSSMFTTPAKETIKEPAKIISAFTRIQEAPSPASSISWIEPVAEEPRRVPISKNLPVGSIGEPAFFQPIRSSSDILREAPSSFENLIRSPSSSREELSAIFNQPPSPEPQFKAPTPTRGGIVGGGVVASRVAAIEKKGSGEKTKQAREVRQALQLSQRTGADVNDTDLLDGFYGNLPSGRRRVPTTEQKARLEKLGKPYIPKKK